MARVGEENDAVRVSLRAARIAEVLEELRGRQEDYPDGEVPRPLRRAIGSFAEEHRALRRQLAVIDAPEG